MSATRTLARYVSSVDYAGLPPEVVRVGKLAILDALGNCIGGYPLNLARTFLDLAKDLGGGRPEASLIGDGTQVSGPLAAFGNGALSTMLDYSDSQSTKSNRRMAWPAALALPAALAAGESRGISGRELIASVVAGYECAARILHSTDVLTEDSHGGNGRDHLGIWRSRGGWPCPGVGRGRDAVFTVHGRDIHSCVRRLQVVGGRRAPAPERHKAGPGLDVHDGHGRSRLGPKGPEGATGEQHPGGQQGTVAHAGHGHVRRKGDHGRPGGEVPHPELRDQGQSRLWYDPHRR